MPTINGRACVANGRNLLLDSQTQMRKPSWYSPNYSWTPEQGTYLRSNIFRTTDAWDNVRYAYKDLLDRGVINTTDNFTYSVYFRVVGEDPAGMSYANIYFVSTATTKNSLIPLELTSLKEGQWARAVVPFKFIDAEYDPTNEYNYAIRVEMSAAPKDKDARYEFAAPKLEAGTLATPLTPAQVDKVFSDGRQVYGRNLLTGTGSHTVTGTESSTAGYLSNETIDDMLTLFKGLEGQTVTVSLDYKYSGFVAGTGTNRLGWEIGITGDSTLWVGAWYSPNNYSGLGRTSTTFVVPKNITGLDEGLGYVQFSGSGTGTISHLKLEKGSVATPYSPAPEDVM